MSRTLSPSVVLTFNGGYVDTAGFITLHGLFVAHITGNFVTVGADFFRGTLGVTAGLLAVPVFCLTVASTRIVSARLGKGDHTTLRILLGAQVLLLALGGLMAVAFGPFPDANGLAAVCTGTALVIAMAVQNAAHRTHLAEAPPSTLVTGSITQLMLDLTDLWLHRAGRPAMPARIASLSTSVVAFALGCGAAALLCAMVGCWALVVPPLLAFLGRRQVCAREFAADIQGRGKRGPQTGEHRQWPSPS